MFETNFHLKPKMPRKNLPACFKSDYGLVEITEPLKVHEKSLNHNSVLRLERKASLPHKENTLFFAS